MKKLFLFGTGKKSIKYTRFFEDLSLDIAGFVDNDSSKWGVDFLGKRIYPPNILNQQPDTLIFIACGAVSEIRRQLTEMDMKEREISFCQIIRSCTLLPTDINVSSHEKKLNISGNRTLLVDNSYGRWGGTEDWCHIVTLSLAERKQKIFLVESQKQTCIKELESQVIHIDTENKSAYEIYQELIHLLIQLKPFTLINVWNSELLWAASIIKWAYPEDVSIISSVLSDVSYEEWHNWDAVTDQYVCISKKIQRTLVNQYGIDQDKVCYIPPFIEKIRKKNRKYDHSCMEPLKIGYPCRLTKTQKRADMIPQLIEYLESEQIDYILNIVGDGPCKQEISEYVQVNNLGKKVKLYGKVSKTELVDFLDHQDIYLNFSAYEGTSLTMLEAMASGCVPVVTNVSGVEDFIESGVNGLIAEVGDLQKIAKYIVYLDRNRSLLSDYGHKCIEIVQEKCRLDKYIDCIENVIDFVVKGKIKGGNS